MERLKNRGQQDKVIDYLRIEWAGSCLNAPGGTGLSNEEGNPSLVPGEDMT